MIDAIPPERLNDLCLRALLRIVRERASGLRTISPSLSRDDLHAVRFYWSMSDWVGQLALRVIDHPREAQEVLDQQVVATDGEITGAIRAQESVIEQQRSGNDAYFVVDEPISVLMSGPNHVVAWCLNEAQRYLQWAASHPSVSRSPEWFTDRMALLNRALRTHALKEVLVSPDARRRPTPAALRAAAKSRLPLYRLATVTFRALQESESLHPERLRELFAQSMIVEMEAWRKFELAAALCASQAIADLTHQPVELDLMLSPGRPLARVGGYFVRWQFSQARRAADRLDPSEALTRALVESLGISSSAGRVDVALFRDGEPLPIALVECKWFESDSSLQDALVDACTQLVGYARDVYPDSHARASSLLQRSLILVASLGELSSRLDGSHPVNCADLQDLIAGRLTTWIHSMALHLDPPVAA